MYDRTKTETTPKQQGSFIIYLVLLSEEKMTRIGIIAGTRKPWFRAPPGAASELEESHVFLIDIKRKRLQPRVLTLGDNKAWLMNGCRKSCVLWLVLAYMSTQKINDL